MMDTKTLTIGVMSIEDSKKRMLKELATRTKAATPRYTFQTPEAMARLLTPPRWNILQALTGAGPLGVRELARRVGRDVKDVHRDAEALVLNGLVDKTTDRKLSFPYKRVRVQFEFKTSKAA
jgi:predicted transcriptional regulator